MIDPKMHRPPSPRVHDMRPATNPAIHLEVLVRGCREEKVNGDAPEVVSAERALRLEDRLIRDACELERLGGVTAPSAAAGGGRSSASSAQTRFQLTSGAHQLAVEVVLQRRDAPVRVVGCAINVAQTLLLDVLDRARELFREARVAHDILVISRARRACRPAPAPARGGG